MKHLSSSSSSGLRNRSTFRYLADESNDEDSTGNYLVSRSSDHSIASDPPPPHHHLPPKEEEEDEEEAKEGGGFVPPLSTTTSISTSTSTTTKKEKIDDIELNESNLTGLEPHPGMSLELLDPDFIWSSATVESIVVVEDPSSRKEVNIRYEGWGSEWDERLSWPHNRLAKLFTYTKRVKCLVMLLPPKKEKKKSAISNALWPCRVSFRMPHPFAEVHAAKSRRAEEPLKVEQNVFVQPYCKRLLPSFIACKLLHNDGIWVNVNKVRKWRGDIFANKLLDESSPFEVAYSCAMQDPTTVGTFPGATQCMEWGSLLKDKYRAKMKGDTLYNGGIYTGDLMESKFPFTTTAANNDPLADDRPAPSMADNTSMTLHSEASEDSHTYNRVVEPPKYEPPPILPQPITIHEPVYEHGLTRLKQSKQWGASVSLGGNILLLEPFRTQTQATHAAKLALHNQDNHLLFDHHHPPNNPNNNNNNNHHYYMDDLQQMDLEKSIAALKAACLDRQQSQISSSVNNNNHHHHNNHNNATNTSSLYPNLHQIVGSFSLHSWTMQQIHHQGYLRQLRECYNQKEENNVTTTSSTSTARPHTQPAILTGSKRKSTPNKVDLVKRIYIPP